jgi:pSer/pThr/pTyr-binding forkhead associated (FHA) protein
VSSYVLGAGETCDIRVTDEYVSARHARVWQDTAGAVWVEDLGSTNGTFVMHSGVAPAVRVIRPARLHPGDVLVLGLWARIPWTVR